MHTNEAGQATYVGITRHPRARALTHRLRHPITRPLGGMQVLTESPLGHYEAHGVEQVLIEHFGMLKPKGATTKFGLLENKISSLSCTHRFYEQATQFGPEWIKQNAP